MCNQYDETECFDEDDGYAKSLLEQGDGGYRPGDPFPVGLGNSIAAQRLRASIGDTLEGHNRHLESLDAQRAESRGDIFRHKIRAGKKLDKMKRLDKRKYETTEVSFDDPDIFPRHLSTDEFKDLYGAISWVNHRTGWVFDAHLTICWKLLGQTTESQQDSWLYDFFIRQYTEWCRYRDIDCLWIYTNEVSDDVGAHTHFMTQLGSEQMADFKKFVEKRMRATNKLSCFNPKSFRITENKKKSLQQQWIQFQYLCKGIEPNARLKGMHETTVLASDLIRFGYESPGQVTCKKRCGVSRNLGKKVRQFHKFESLLDKGVLDVRKLYPRKNASASWDEIQDALKTLNL